MWRATLLVALAGGPVLAATAARFEQRRVCVRPVSIAASASTCELSSVDRATTGSRRCLGCHDGSIAEDMAPGPRFSGNHPIEIDYLTSWRGSAGRLRHPGELPAALPLVEGKVACTTCHAAAATEPGKPALTMERSAMCFACHAM